MKKIKMLKTIFLISLLSIIFIISCRKKEEVSISNNSVHVSSPENIYHAVYTNVVKIQGKFVNMNSSLSYADR